LKPKPTKDNECVSENKKGAWIDEDNKIRSDCIDCGGETDYSNRCYDCWEKAGCPWSWNNQEIGKLYQPKVALP